MFIGICELELFIPESGSLKSKRFVLSSLKTRLRNNFNVSVSEVGDNEKWQRATLGISMVANEKKYIDKAMHKVLSFIDNIDDVEMTKHQIEIL